MQAVGGQGCGPGCFAAEFMGIVGIVQNVQVDVYQRDVTRSCRGWVLCCGCSLPCACRLGDDIAGFHPDALVRPGNSRALRPPAPSKHTGTHKLRA